MLLWARGGLNQKTGVVFHLRGQMDAGNAKDVPGV